MNLLIESSVSSVPKMPGFFSHRRKLSPAPAGNWAAIPNSLYTKSFVGQKIHPDLNSLAEELSSSKGHELLDMTADKGDPYAEATGFVGLEPSTRGIRRQNEAHTRTQEPQPVAMELEYQPFGIPVLDSASDIITENFPNVESREDDNCLPDATSSPSSSPISIKASSSKNRWSIFGSNRARALHRNSDASNATSNVSRPRSQSSSSQPRSHSTSQRIAGAASRTPKSQYSMYNSTGSTPSYNLERDGLLPSPHTFGISTSPKEPIAESADDNSYFGFRETPPPLPPLDHPAFRQASRNHISSASNHFLIQTNRDDVQDKFTRHSHSLPSLAHSGSSDTQYDIKRAKKRHRSLREDSELTSINKTKKQHNRNDSVASSIGTRRYSAEYSAKKASSVGHEENKQDECWEVQVSKEIVRLALDGTSPFGKACGKNVGFSICHQSCFIPFIFLVFFSLSLAGVWRGIGAWFTISFARRVWNPNIACFRLIVILADMKNNNIDTLTRNLKDTKPPTAISSPKLIYKSSNVATKPLRANIMSQASEYASRKGKERESGATLVHSSHSRRGRTNSTPSMNRNPTPPPNIDTTPFFGSIAGASSLLVPHVSVISPTPDVSPITPSRRPHHKSQPTMPKTSFLERPNTPPVIGQSQSTGKRKAEEADVGGDKTPPKDPKEQRATFAPDPRSMSPFFLPRLII